MRLNTELSPQIIVEKPKPLPILPINLFVSTDYWRGAQGWKAPTGTFYYYQYSNKGETTVLSEPVLLYNYSSLEIECFFCKPETNPPSLEKNVFKHFEIVETTVEIVKNFDRNSVESWSVGNSPTGTKLLKPTIEEDVILKLKVDKELLGKVPRFCNLIVEVEYSDKQRVKCDPQLENRGD